MEKGANDKSYLSYSKRVIMDFDSQVETHSQDWKAFLIGSFRRPSSHVIIPQIALATSSYFKYRGEGLQILIRFGWG